MKLYYSPASCSLAANIAFAEAGIAYEMTKVDLAKHLTEDGKDFYAINDKGYVPFLSLDSGEGLSEGVAILQYIADLKPESNLAPANGTMARYQLQSWLTYINSEVHKSMGGLFDSGMDAVERARAVKKIGSRLDWLSKKLTDKTYLTGDAFTVADAYLFVVLNWGQFVGVDIANWPVLAAFQARVSARPAVQKALGTVGLLKAA
jgi:glutathione S-transferase